MHDIRRRLAIHESGHAVVAHVLGIPVIEAWIDEERGGEVLNAYDTDPPVDTIKVLLAGRIAETMWRYPVVEFNKWGSLIRDAGCGTDEASIASLWPRLAGLVHRETLEAETERLLAQHEAAVERFARSLERAGRLHGDGLEAALAVAFPGMSRPTHAPPKPASRVSTPPTPAPAAVERHYQALLRETRGVARVHRPEPVDGSGPAP